MPKLFQFAGSLLAVVPALATGGLVVTEQAGPPSGPSVFIQSTGQDNGGNTRFRYFPDRTGAPDKTDVIESAPALSYYYQRDRDLGQTFTVGAEAFKLDAVTLRVGFDPEANQGSAGGARVSLQLLEVTGNPVVTTNGSPPKSQTQWQTYDPNYIVTDDYITGETYTSLRVARGGVLPANVGKDMFLRWDLTGDDEILLEAGRRYAFVVMFDEPAKDRGLALANNFNGNYSGGHGIRRCGSSINRADVFVRNLAEPADVEASRQSAMFPADPAARAAISPGTLGYPDVDTYRDFRFYIQGIVPPQPPQPDPPLSTAVGTGADTFIDSVAPGTAQGTATRARIRTVGTLRKAYFRFDLSGIAQSGVAIDGAALALRMASTDNAVPNPLTVNLYGLIDGDPGEDWSETITWNSGAPAHAGAIGVTSAATFLGSFMINGGTVTAGQMISLGETQIPGLLAFLQGDTDDRVTFIASYVTATDKSLDFSTKENVSYGGAALTIAPVVATGPPQAIKLPATAQLAGTVDGKSILTSDTTVVWTKVTGPGPVIFGAASAVETIATFSAPGDFLLELTATRGSFARKCQLAVTVRDSLAAWTAREFPVTAPAADLLPDADPENDQLTNLMEYGFASDPQLNTTAHAPFSAIEGEFVTLTYRCNLLAGDLTYALFQSGELTEWRPANPLEEILSDNGKLRVVKAKVPTDGEPKKFLQLEITAEP